MSMVRTKRRGLNGEDSKSDNIILELGMVVERNHQKDLSKTDKIQLDMLHIDELSESVMIQMIHTFAEKGVDIADKEFIRSIGFIDECKSDYIKIWV